VQKLTHLAFIIIFTSCGSEPDFQEIMINKTVKVFSQDYHNDAENYTFKWEPPVGPSKMVVPFDLKNDMLIFSPKLEGDYQIHLSITDISDEVIAEEMFYYRAIAETIEVAIAKPNPEEDITKQISTVNEPKKKTRAKTNINQQSKTRKKQNKESTNIDNVHYTIQVAAWPSLEHARLDQLKLIEEGMDAYIQRHYRNEDDQVWYRVRIGNFKSKENASIVQKQIESITHAETWLDILPSGQK
ncbi:uncharacterized protein METZ01_LOCUS41819, partial [marine metagenome]